MVVGGVIPGMAAANEGRRVTIVGGADATGHRYTWTITNEDTSPIVYVEFPHYRANLFFSPHGWSTDESTFLVNVGVEERPGLCIARAASTADGIAPGQSATFSTQIAAAGAQRRRGNVQVQFADGTKTIVSGVELPQRETLGDEFIPLIGLGVIFVGWMVVQVIRSRRRASDVTSGTTPTTTES